MTNIVYSKKEIAIFTGVITLMQEGVNPYYIKVSDIAESADVGKGTIYDYFASKEEAISKAILYNINNELETGLSRIMAKDSFKGKFYEVLCILVENMDSKTSTFNMLSSAGGISEFYEYVLDDKYDLYKYVSRINDMISHLLVVGVEEALISEVEDSYYGKMVVNSAIIGFSQYINQRHLYADTSIEEAMKSAYKLLIKGLN
ncbi:MAG TPA: helix-turn-helix domain-containing protein [Clostridia bacterium]|nr:helix-turn-helix domain-containing protein [Clostridia bacterium]